MYDSCVKKEPYTASLSDTASTSCSREERKSKGSLCVISMRMCMCVLLLFPPNSSTLEANRPDTRAQGRARKREDAGRERHRDAHTTGAASCLSLSLSRLGSPLSLSLSLLFCNSRCGHSKIKRGEAANERCVLRWLTASLPFGCSSVSLSMIFQASRFSASGRRVPLEPRRSEACRSCQPMHVLSFGEGRSLFFCVPVRVRQPAFGKCELASWWSLI